MQTGAQCVPFARRADCTSMCESLESTAEEEAEEEEELEEGALEDWEVG